MKAIIPRMMPKKQANRDKIMNARVASQYAVNTHKGQKVKGHVIVTSLFAMHE